MTVIVTGGGHGLGRAISETFAGAGSKVVVADLDGEAAGAVAAGLPAGVAFTFDARSDGDFEALRDFTIATWGRVDIVINNVGVIAAGLPQHIPTEEWMRVIDINLLSVVRSVKTFVPAMVAAGRGYLVNVASTAGLYGYQFDRLPYSTSKAGIVSLSEGLALYLRPLGVGVTCFCPGAMTGGLIGGAARRFGPEVGIRPPALVAVPVLEGARMLLAAVRADRFLALTHPEVADILAGRGADLDGFVQAQTIELGRP